jgi:hypothetical protein
MGTDHCTGGTDEVKKQKLGVRFENPVVDENKGKFEVEQKQRHTGAE